MLTISMFYGLIIQMYYAHKEHNPPHFHVQYQGEKAQVNILTGDVMKGKLSPRNYHIILAWIELHRDELLANWTLCQNGDEPVNINPLQ
jgi:hypothetical protein